MAKKAKKQEVKQETSSGKWIIIVGVIVILVITAIFFLQRDTKTNSEQNDSNDLTNLTPPPIPNIPVKTTYNVDIKDMSYNASVLRIKVGDVVIWTNRDNVTHSVTSDTGSELNSPQLSYQHIYQHTFSRNGTYDYHCIFHSSMRGRIIVV